MPMLTSNSGGVLRPEEVGPLIVQPVSKASVGFAVSTVVSTQSHDFRLPQVLADPATGFFAEGAEIDVTDGDISELLLVSAKCAGITTLSRELANDSSPEAQQVVGDSLARDMAKKVDAAMFGTTTPNAPAGLGALVGVQTVDGDALTNLDWAAEALSKSEDVGGVITSFIASPRSVLILSTLKKLTGSNEPLLQSVTQTALDATSRQVLGVPLYSSPAVPDDEVWAIDKRFSYVVVREDAVIEVDSSPFFTSDRVAVKAIIRLAWGWPHPASVIKINVNTGS